MSRYWKDWRFGGDSRDAQRMGIARVVRVVKMLAWSEISASVFVHCVSLRVADGVWGLWEWIRGGRRSPE